MKCSGTVIRVLRNTIALSRFTKLNVADSGEGEIEDSSLHMEK
jgi:hypothetical protein